MVLIVLGLGNASFAQNLQPRWPRGRHPGPARQALRPPLIQRTPSAYARASTFVEFKTLNFEGSTGIYRPSYQTHSYYNGQGNIELLVLLDPAGVDTFDFTTYLYNAQARFSSSSYFRKFGTSWELFEYHKATYYTNNLLKTYLEMYIMMR